MTQGSLDNLRIGFYTCQNQSDIIVISGYKRGSYMGIYVISEIGPHQQQVTPSLVWRHEDYIAEPWDLDVLEEIKNACRSSLQFIHHDLQHQSHLLTNAILSL